MRKLLVIVAVAFVGLLASVSVAQGQEGDDTTPAEVEAAFADLTRADLESMGYAVEEECITAEDIGAPAALGAMGFHAINEGLIDETLDPLAPEVVLLDADDNVVAIEYLSPTEGEVLGQQLEFVPPIEMYAVHLWFLDNPAGQFAAFNTNASCPEVVTAIAATGTGGYLDTSGNATSTLVLVLAIAGAAVAFGGIALRRVTAR